MRKAILVIASATNRLQETTSKNEERCWRLWADTLVKTTNITFARGYVGESTVVKTDQRVIGS